MANINNEQRKAFADIVEANGRSQEFYEKYGKDRVEKHRKAAQTLLKKILSDKDAVKALERKHQAEENALESKNREIRRKIENAIRTSETKMSALGFSTTNEWENGEYKTVLSENTSITHSEYEMFKKRALAAIWGASTLDEANKAIQDYLNLVK